MTFVVDDLHTDFLGAGFSEDPDSIPDRVNGRKTNFSYDEIIRTKYRILFENPKKKTLI